MKVNPSDIIDLCSRNSIEVQLISMRFRFKECPFCGNNKWKVWLYEKDQAGSCFRCHTKFNIYTLLEKYGVPKNELSLFNRYAIEYKDDLTLIDPIVNSLEEQQSLPSFSLPSHRYWRIDERPDHPASKYAIRRGVPEALYSEVIIDVEANAVVFLVRLEGKLVGYQERYVDPKSESKTWTAKGFKCGQFLLTYERPEGQDLFICEGPFNAITAYNWGHTGICTFGSMLSAVQIRRIRELARKTGKKICCAFDMDDAGLKAYLQVKSICDAYGVDVVKILPEYGNDLNESWAIGKKYTVDTDDTAGLLHFLPELK